MSNMEKLYRSVLEFAGCHVNDAGFIQVRHGNKSTNVIIDGKDLVFPTLEHQRKAVPNTVMFHPLSENEFGNESDVLKRLRELTFLRLNTVTMHLMNDLISIISSVELHKNLGKGTEILFKSINVDKNSRKALLSLVTADKGNLAKMFVTGWVRRGGQVKGQTYSRAGIVHFPLYTKLAESSFLDDKPKGVRTNDPEAFRKLMQYIYPSIESPAEYCQGSDSRLAPSFEAFLKMALRVAEDLQIVLDTFQENLIDASEYSFDTSWGEWIGKIDSLRSEAILIPNQSGIVVPTAPAQVSAPVAAPVTGQLDLASAMAAMNRQMSPANVIPKPTTGKKSLADLASSNPTLANNTLMQNAQMQQMSGQNAIAALMSGQSVQPNAAGALMAMMGQQQQQQQQLINQYGVDGARQIMGLMSSGMSMQDAVMRYLAMKPPVDPTQQMLAQLLATQQQANPQAQLLAALAAQAQGGNVLQPGVQTPVGYPAGQQVIINGRPHLQYQLADGTIQQIPL